MTLLHRKHSLLVVSAVLVAAFGSASAQTPVSAPAGDFTARLKAINAKSAKVADLSADFVQEKQSPLLRNPLVSRGTITAKGERSLWQTMSPQKTTMSSDSQTLRLYFPDRHLIEEYPMRSQLGMMAASPLPSLEAIEKSFTVLSDAGDGLIDAKSPADRVAVRLAPKMPDIQQYVDHVRVLLDVERGLVLAFELTDPDGEITLIRFSNIRTDTGVADTAVQLNVPAGAKTVRPLGDTEAPHP